MFLFRKGFIINSRIEIFVYKDEKECFSIKPTRYHDDTIFRRPSLPRKPSRKTSQPLLSFKDVWYVLRDIEQLSLDVNLYLASSLKIFSFSWKIFFSLRALSYYKEFRIYFLKYDSNQFCASIKIHIKVSKSTSGAIVISFFFFRNSH